MSRTGQVRACCSMKRNLTSASPRRCRWLFLRRRAPCGCDRARGGAARSRPPDRHGDATGVAGELPRRGRVRSAARRRSAAARQFRSIDGWIPSSAAICICGRPLLSSSATASRLNSGVNSRLVFVIRHRSAPKGAYQRCPSKRGKPTSHLRRSCGADCVSAPRKLAELRSAGSGLDAGFPVPVDAWA